MITPRCTFMGCIISMYNCLFFLVFVFLSGVVSSIIRCNDIWCYGMRFLLFSFSNKEEIINIYTSAAWIIRSGKVLLSLFRQMFSISSYHFFYSLWRWWLCKFIKIACWLCWIALRCSHSVVSMLCSPIWLFCCILLSCMNIRHK